MVLSDLAKEIKASRNMDVALQLGWKSAGAKFTVAAGKINVPLSPVRDATPQDTFTYGSGTKPVTAAAVMRLIDAGRLRREDKLHTYIDPYLQRNAGTTLAELYGSDANNSTVLQILRMSAGIPDFENGDVDADILAHASRSWSPYEFMQRAKAFPMPCKPGECSAYSSTSFELAGLLLAALQNPSGNWTDFDMRSAAFSDKNRYVSLSFPADSGKIADTVTATALTDRGTGWPDNVVIREQNPSILGWTCGNMVGTAGDVAAFYHDLLAPVVNSSEQIVSDAARAEMMRFELQTKGWGAGWLSYGAGLMEQVGHEGASMNSSSPSKPDDWNYYIGHGGLTYGYSAEQGYIPKIGAAFAVVSNTDHQEFVFTARCRLFEAAAKFLKGEDIYFNCKSIEEVFPNKELLYQMLV